MAAPALSRPRGSIAAIWSDALDRAVRYGGDDLATMEQRMKAVLPGWHGLDLRLSSIATRATARRPILRRSNGSPPFWRARRDATATSPGTPRPSGRAD
jgi:hypothetical protein